MGLLRLLVIVVVIWLALSVIKWLRHRVIKERNTRSAPEVTRMVRCAYCGLYVTSDEAVRAGDQTFCSSEHKASLNRNHSS